MFGLLTASQELEEAANTSNSAYSELKLRHRIYSQIVLVWMYKRPNAWGSRGVERKFSVNNRTQDVATTALWGYPGCFLLWFLQQPNTMIQRNSSNHALDAGLMLHRTLTSVIAHGEAGDVTGFSISLKSALVVFRRCALESAMTTTRRNP